MKKIIATLLSLVVLFGVVSITPIETKAIEGTTWLSDDDIYYFIDKFTYTLSETEKALLEDKIKAVNTDLEWNETNWDTVQSMSNKLLKYLNKGSKFFPESITKSDLMKLGKGSLSYISGMIEVVKNIRYINESDSNNLQKAYHGIQIVNTSLKTIGLARNPSVAAFCAALDVIGQSLLIGDIIYKTNMEECVQLYKADLALAYYSGDTLPEIPTFQPAFISVIGEEDFYQKCNALYVNYCMLRMKDSLLGNAEDQDEADTTITESNYDLEIKEDKLLGMNCYVDGDVKISNCTVDLYGHVLSCTGSLYIENCTIRNTASGGKIRVGNDLSYSGNIYIYSNINVTENFKFTSSTTSSLRLYSGAKLTAKATNFNPTPFFGSGTSYLYINSGAQVEITNNFVMNNRLKSGSNWMYHYFKTYVRGTLLIHGDYMPDAGTIIQDSSSSNITVYGDWLWYKENTYYSRAEELTAGTLKIYGNVCEPIKASSSHTLELCGDKQQNVYRGFEIANFRNTNSSSGGVVIKETSTVNGQIYCPSSTLVDGKNIQLSGGFQGEKYKGDITLINPSTINHDLTIDGNLFCFNNSTGNVYINNANVTINGNLTAEAIGFYGSGDSYLRINNQSKVKVKGDVTLKGNGFSFSNWMYHHSNCIIDGELDIDGSFNTKAYSHITLNNKQAKIETDGDFYGRSSEAITTGYVEVGGNVYYLKTEGNAVLHLKGNAIQTIDGSAFSTIISDNLQGISFSKAINVTTLFNHKGNPFSLYNNGNGSSFVDYDGDGLNDNVDPNPTVGNPCTISFAANNSEYGTVAQESIDTVGGTTINNTATPTSKYTFVKWIDENNNTISTSRNLEVIAKVNKSYTAIFEKRKRNIYVTCEGGTINVPATAVIESEVNVSYKPDEGYVYENGSLKYNEIVIENNSFIMPDETVFITATFNRNENYFTLKEKINEAKGYASSKYTKSSYKDLNSAISTAELYLVNDVSNENSTKQIELLSGAINNLIEIRTIMIDPSITNGTVTYEGEANELIEGVTVNLSVVPAQGYEIDSLVVKKVNNETIKVTNNSFVIPDTDVTVTATFKKKPIIIYNYKVYDENTGLDIDKTVSKTVSGGTYSDIELAELNMPYLRNARYNYSIDSVERNGDLISVTIKNSDKKYTVTLDNEEIGKYSYLETATINLDEEKSFLVNGKVVFVGKSYSFYVGSDTTITTDVPRLNEEYTFIDLNNVTVSDNKVELDMLATANVGTGNFQRMGVAFALSEKSETEISVAVQTIETGTATSNKIAVHNSSVNMFNQSGQYQFRYAPYFAKEKAKNATIYFYTYVVTDEGIRISDSVQYNMSNLLA